MSGAHDLRLIVQYFGRAAAACAAAGAKAAKPTAILEAAKVAGLRRSGSVQTAAQMLVEGAQHSRPTNAGQSRAMSTTVARNIGKEERLSAFELQRFGVRIHTFALNARTVNN